MSPRPRDPTQDEPLDEAASREAAVAAGEGAGHPHDRAATEAALRLDERVSVPLGDTRSPLRRTGDEVGAGALVPRRAVRGEQWQARLDAPVQAHHPFSKTYDPARGIRRHDYVEMPRGPRNEAWLEVLWQKDVGWLPGCDADIHRRLHGHGIDTVGVFMAADPWDLVAATGIPEWRVKAYRSAVRLVAVPGLDRRSAWQLVLIGVAHTEDLINADAEVLVERLNEAEPGASADAVRYHHSVSKVRRWQEVALTLATV